MGSKETESWQLTCAENGSLVLTYRLGDGGDPNQEDGTSKEGGGTMRRVFAPAETARVSIWTSGGADTETIVDGYRCRIDFEFNREVGADRFPGMHLGIPDWN